MPGNKGLSREQLRWVQSLDLSYALKNPVNDLSSGFLVAEILSRYYPNSVEMHRFDKGSALDRKRDNWAQLGDLFALLGLAIDDYAQVVEGIVNRRPGFVSRFMNKLYVFLTSRTVRADVFIRKAPSEERRLVEAGETEEMEEKSEKHEEKVQDIVAPPEVEEPATGATMEEEKEEGEEPKVKVFARHEDFVRSGVIHRVTTDGSSAEAQGFVKAKAVEIKPLDISVMQLRKKRAMGMSVSQSVASMRSDPHSIVQSRSQYSFASGPPPEDQRKIIAAVTNQILDALGEESVSSLGDLSAMVREADTSAEALAGTVLENLRSRAHDLVDPRGMLCTADYAGILDLAFGCFQMYPSTSETFLASAEFVAEFGGIMCAVDAYAARVAFCDFGACAVAQAMSEDHAKVSHAIIALTASAATDVNRALCLKRLESELSGSLSTHIRFLALFVRRSTPSKHIASSIAKACSDGMTAPLDSDMRAAALSLIPAVLIHSPIAVAEQAETLRSFFTEKSWKVRSRLLIAAASIISSDNVPEDHAETLSSLALDAVMELLTPDIVQKHCECQDEAFQKEFADALLGLLSAPAETDDAAQIVASVVQSHEISPSPLPDVFKPVLQAAEAL